jgi:hypothetical protein
VKKIEVACNDSDRFEYFGEQKKEIEHYDLNLNALLRQIVRPFSLFHKI